MNPDLDAVTSVWMLQRFDKEDCQHAEVAFVVAGDRLSTEELRRRGLDAHEVYHVDTGLGPFDHHTEKLAHEKVCAASLVRDYVCQKYPDLAADEALRRISDFAVEIDHFGEFSWPDPNNDRYLFMLDEILKHIKTIGGSDEDVVEFAKKALDSIYAGFGARIAAEDEVKSGVEFETKWGKALGVETANDEVIKFGQKAGFVIVVRKDPDAGNVRIKAIPGAGIDLTAVYEKIIASDSKATWYLHPAKTMLLNGSRKHENQVPSKLSLSQIIKFIEEL